MSIINEKVEIHSKDDDSCSSLPSLQNSNSGSAEEEMCSLESSKKTAKEKSWSNKSKENFCNSRQKHSSQKVRIVSSKYKQAAVNFVQKNQSNNNSGEVSSPSFCASKNKSLSSSSYKVLKKSLASGLNKPDILPSKLKAGVASSRKNSNPKPNRSKPVPPNPKLHSTAIYTNEDTRCDASEIFSTTVVSSGPKRSSIPDISQISSIRSDGSFNDTPASAMEPVFEEDDVFPEDICETDLEQEYREYLLWSHLHLSQELKFQKEEQKIKRQLTFLASLVEKEHEKLLQKEKMLALLDHHKEVTRKHNSLKNALETFNEATLSTGQNLKILSSNLESKLNEVELENIHLPSDKQKFNEELLRLINVDSSLKEEINQSLESKRQIDENLTTLFATLQEAVTSSEPCAKEVDKCASLSIQEASLKITLDTLQSDKKALGENF